MLELWILFAIALGVGWIGVKIRFYSALPDQTSENSVLLYTVAAFSILVIGVYGLLGSVIHMILQLLGIKLSFAWISALLHWVGLVFLLFLGRFSPLSSYITQKISKIHIKGGLQGWLLIYPVVILMGQLTVLFLEVSGLSSELNQLAVQDFLSSKGATALLFAKACAIVIVIPLVEEILFRGFLLETLLFFFSKWTAIILSSCIFAISHFSSSQGWGNLILFFGIMPLALQLAYLRLKYRSLYPCWVTHALFNFIQVNMVYMSM